MPRANPGRPVSRKAIEASPVLPTPGGCEITELFRLLGKAHTLSILHVLIEESATPRRFVEIQHRLKLSPNTLSERLKELEEAGLVSRKAYNEIPPRVDYEATPKARALKPVFEALDEWAHHHDLSKDPGEAPVARA